MAAVNDSITKILFIGAAGSIGCMLRYALAGAVQKRAGVAFPAGTLCANTLGCFAIGFLAARFEASLTNPNLRAAILVGLLGGFTTFSTFSLETLKLVQDRQYPTAAANAFFSLACCLLAVWFGQRIAQWSMSP